MPIYELDSGFFMVILIQWLLFEMWQFYLSIIMVVGGRWVVEGGWWKVSGGRKVANKGPENRGGALSPETKDLFCLRISFYLKAHL